MASSNSTLRGWCQDDSFGPAIQGCRGNFDFTLLFEESILSILPSAILLLLVPGRLYQLSGSPKKVRHSPLQLVKLTNCVLYLILQIELLVRWTRPHAALTRLSVATAAIGMIDAFAIGILSFFDHNRSVRPSTILQIYLTISLLFDIARTRTLWLLSTDHLLVRVFTTAVVSKAMMLFLELAEKRSYLESNSKHLPRETTSGFANIRVWWWLNRILWTGSGKILGMPDLDAVEEEFSSDILQERLLADWSRVKNPEAKNALMFTTAKTFKWSLLAGVFPRLCVTGFTYAQPFLMTTLINHVESESKDRNAGYGLIGAYILVFFGAAIAQSHYAYEVIRMTTKVRGGLVTVIYSTTQDLHITSINENAAATLMSTDVERIGRCLNMFHNLWAVPLEVAIAIYLLERQLGAACVVPIILAIGCSLFSMFLSGRIGRAQGAWLEAIQKRLNFTTTMLGSMKEVKMTGLTDILSSFIQQTRLDEIMASFPYRKIMVWSITISDFTNALGPVLTFALFTIISRMKNDQALLASQAFTSLTVLSLMGFPIMVFIQTLPHMIAARHIFTRIQDFLTAESRKDNRISLKDSRSSSPHVELSNSDIELAEFKPTAKVSINDRTAISIVDGAFGWDDKKPSVLEDISIKIVKGSLTMIIGPVGCGKSTLLSSFLGESRVSKGFIHVASREMSYCDQSSWIFNATARQNIIGISEFDPAWYKTVVDACALQKDMEDLPQGDETVLGSKGIAISGGQKQRIAIARAIYSRKDIALFDDVLTGLDATTEDHVFTQVLGPRGLLRKLGTTVVLVTHKVRRLNYADHLVVLGQSRTIAEQGDFAQLKAAGGYVTKLLAQGDEAEETTPDEITPSKKAATRKDVVATQSTVTPDTKRQSGDLSTYRYFFKSSGRLNVSIMVLMSIASAFCGVYSTLWLQQWVETNSRTPNKDVAYYMCIYALLGVIAEATLWMFCWQLFIFIIPRSGRILHSILLQATLRAPLSFLTMTDTGVTINRFSQDLQLVDSSLEGALVNTLESVNMTILRIIIVCITAKYFATTIPFALVAVYLVQRYYLRTSRQLRLLDIEAKAPLYSHFIETLSGLATIRAYGWQTAMQKQNHGLMDAAQKPFYLLACIQKWLAFVLDILTAVLAIIVVIFAVTLRGSMSGGETGVAMLNVVNANQTLMHVIISWTALETAIGAVARIRSFAQDTPSEARPDAHEPDTKTWPSAGAISFDNVSASYSPESPLVLKNVDMSIAAGEKVGICGRSGSGKSSTILSLLQMLEVRTGSVKIDGIDLMTLTRESVRSSLITISQDAVFIEGSIRLNMDPHSLVSDDTIVMALKSVHLWDVIQEKGGLDARSADVNLSHGQQQLFCLGRAIIRKGKILLLDEATSSIDSETNKIMQELIRKEFKDHTIISVEHTLENILDFDKIAVFDTGSLVEFDSPVELLGRASAFKALYTRGGR